MSAGDAARTYAWYGIRLTGVALAVLLPVQAAVVLVRDDVGHATFATVSQRLSGPWWPGVEWVTLVLALVHGHLVASARLGARVGPGWRNRTVTVATAVIAVALGLGATRGMLAFS